MTLIIKKLIVRIKK